MRTCTPLLLALLGGLACHRGAGHVPPDSAAHVPPASAAPAASGDEPDAGESFITPDNPQIAANAPPVLEATGDPRRVDLGGGWTATLHPGTWPADFGDEVAVRIELRASRPGSGRALLLPRSPGVRVLRGAGDVDAEGWLPAQGGVAHAVLLAGPADWSSPPTVDVFFRERQARGSASHGELALAVLRVGPGDASVAVAAWPTADRCHLPRGLGVLVAGRSITVYLSSGVLEFQDALRPSGDFVLRTIAGRWTLVGFVRQDNSDLAFRALVEPRCRDAPPHASLEKWSYAVMARFEAPGPGPLDVVIHWDHGGRVRRLATAVVVE